MGSEQRVTEGDVEWFGLRVEGQPLEQPAEQRVPIGVRAGGGEPDEHVAGRDARAGEHRRAFHGADECSGDVERAGRVDTGHFRRLPTEEYTARGHAGPGHLPDESSDDARVERCRGDVVEEEQRTRPLDEHVVDAVVDDVRPDARRAAGTRRELDLRSHAVGGGDEDRLVVVLEGGDVECPTEAADAGEHRRAVRLLHTGAHLGDGPVALVDVHASRGVAAELRPGGPPGDVRADLHPVEVDIPEHRVGRGARCGEVAPETGDTENPSSGDDEPVVFIGFRPGVEHERARSGCRGQVQRHAEHRCSRVPRGGGDDGARRGVGGDPHGSLGEPSLAAGEEHLEQVVVDEGEHRLCFGIAEAAVVLEQPGTVGGQHQPGEENPDVGGALGSEMIDHRLDERRRQLLGAVGHGGGGVGPHPSGVRSGVPGADPLVVLGEGQGDGGSPVAQGEQRALRAAEALLDDDLPFGGEGADRLLALRVVAGDDHSLARGEPGELDDDGCAEGPPPLQRARRVAEHGVPGGGDRQLRGQGAGECLRRLQPGIGRARPERRDPHGAQLVDDAGGKRRFRADHDEADPLVVAVAGDPRRVGRREGDTLAGRSPVAGSDADRRAARRGGELPGQGVFPAASSDDEDVDRGRRLGRAAHASTPSKESLSWVRGTSIG